MFEKEINKHIDAFKKLSEIKDSVEKSIVKINNALKHGNKVLVSGNGGSAADSQHLAAELVVRFEKFRKSIPALALTVDTSIITACANDYSYDEIFSRQVESLGKNPKILKAQ